MKALGGELPVEFFRGVVSVQVPRQVLRALLELRSTAGRTSSTNQRLMDREIPETRAFGDQFW